jgi:imidazolonepropionase
MAAIIGPFNQIITMGGLPARGPLGNHLLKIQEDAWVAVSQGKVSATGDRNSLTNLHPAADVVVMQENTVLLPGFIDSHTHICWAGNRSADFAMRMEGKTYLEIAKAGGGIWSSVEQCRNAGREELATGIALRAAHLVASGVTTIEVKSGYGLEVEAELKVLQAIADANGKTMADLVPTCLAAHMKPKDFSGSERDYLDHLIEVLLPLIKDRSLAGRIDIFIERSAFSVADGLHFLRRAKELGFSLTVHGDQFTTGGSQAAIDAGAVSVDHLEASTEREIGALAASEVIATVLPGASLGLGMPFAPARKLLDAGCSVAIASDWNPGSAPMGELLVQASILGIYEKLSAAELLAGLTCRAASALGMQDRGKLTPGMRADMQAYPVADYREIFYNQGRIRPEAVWVAGELALSQL